MISSKISKEKITECIGVNEYRWYWNSSLDPWNDTGEAIWAPYPLNLSQSIEDNYNKKLPSYEFDIYGVSFDYSEKSEHYQYNIEEPWKARPVSRNLPSEIKNIMRPHRHIAKLEPECERMYQCELFSYTSLFHTENVHSDLEDPFILQFTRHIVLLDQQFIQLLTKDYIEYLSNVHNLMKEELNFNKITGILTKDMESSPIYALYPKYYLGKITKENFHEVIIAMYTEEGDLVKNLNTSLRSKNFQNHMNLIFYFLCLLFVLERAETNGRSRWCDILYRGLALEEDEYENEKKKLIGNNDHVYLINDDLMTTSKSKEYILNWMNISRKKHKLVFEINCEDSFAGLFPSRPIDIEGLSKYPVEREVIIPPNGIFVVKEFTEKEGDEISCVKLSFIPDYLDNILATANDDRRSKFGLFKNMIGKTESEYHKIISVCLQENQMNMTTQLINLRSLDLFLNSNTTNMKNLVSCLEHCRHMINLSLKWNYKPPEGIAQLSSQIGNFKYLCSLSLHGILMDTISVESISEHFQNFLFLKSLCMNWVSFGDEGMKVFSSKMKNLHHLHHLELKGNIIGVEGIVAFSSNLEHVNNLKTLNLYWNCIGDEGMMKLCERIDHLQNLQYLNVSWNQIGRDGIIEFTKHLHVLTQFKELVAVSSVVENKSEGEEEFKLLFNKSTVLKRKLKEL